MNTEDSKIFENWLKELNAEQRAMKDVLDTFLEDKSHEDGVCGFSRRYYSTTDIIDSLMDVCKMEMSFINVYLHFQGYHTARAEDGKVKWLMWESEY